MTQQVAGPAEALDVETLLSLLEPKPRTLPQILDLVPPPSGTSKEKWEQGVKSALDQMRRQGRLFAHRSSGRQPRYWVHDEKEQVREAVLKILQDRPRSRKQLEEVLPQEVPTGASKSWLLGTAESLCEEGAIHLHPRAGSHRADRFGLEPPTLRDYLNKEMVERLSGVCKKLARAGIPVQTLLTDLANLAVPPTDAEVPRPSQVITEASEKVSARTSNKPERLLELMCQLERDADQGATVSLPELRQRADFLYPSKSLFDQAVLELATAGLVDLHRHVTPTLLPEEERQALVPDDEGSYFIGIAKRV